MKTLLLSPLRDGTGNATTMRRIEGHLRDDGQETLLLPIDGTPPTEHITEAARHFRPDAMIGIHAIRAGEYLLRLRRETGAAFAVILGGTDINEPAQGERQLLHDVIEESDALVAFAPYMATKAAGIAGRSGRSIDVIPPSILLTPSDRNMRPALNIAAEDTLCLLPAGVRAVKDPLFLQETAELLYAETRGRFRLVLAGPALDPKLESTIRAADRGAGFLYTGTLALPDMHAAMRQATFIANTSRSEGLSNAVMEGMRSGRLVLARRNEGNAAAVEHGVTGLLFETAETCADLLRRALREPAWREDIARRGAAYACDAFDPVREREAYVAVTRRLATKRG